MGFKPYDLKTKMILYADGFFFLQPEKNSLHALIYDSKLVARFSRLKLNFEKCTIMRIGTIRDRDFNFKVPCSSQME